MSEMHYTVALPEGLEIGGYRLLRVLGDGGFGVTYMAEDFRNDRFAVKEYLPNQFAVRDGIEVHPKSKDSREDFEWGRERFVEEARMLARFEHPNIVKVKHFFKENNTAYIVMEYEDGEPLDEVLRRRGALTEAQLTRILLPITSGLREVHMQGVWHRDIKPSNVFVRRSDESPVLLDFGAARNALGVKSKSMEAIISPPYSPPEQYYSEGELGPWTDIYALSALCFQAITGEPPAESLFRQRRLSSGRTDPLRSLVETPPPDYSSELLAAVDWGLALDEEGRPQSVEEWLVAVEGDEAPDDAVWEGQPDGKRRTHLQGIEPEEAQSAGIFQKLVRGQYGLAKTYWLFGVFGGFAMGVLDRLAAQLDGTGVASLGVVVVYLMYQSAVVVGVWRAGRAYGGPAIWYVLARVAVLVGLAVLTMTLLLRASMFVDVANVIDSIWPSTIDDPPRSAVGSLTVTNRSEHDIVVVRAAPTTHANYGDNKLGTATIVPRGRTRISLYEYDYGGACEFDVLIKAADGRVHEDKLDLCGDNVVVFGANDGDAKTDPEPDVVPPPPPPASRRDTEIGERFRDCPTCPELVVVPAGSYKMGSPPGEQGRDAREGPAHEVTFATPFAIGAYEVTVSEFRRFVEETSYSAGNSCNTFEDGEYEDRIGRGWRNPGIVPGGKHPVACVSWDDAQAYVAWLSRKTGEGYRLPSEAEWEYAARAGTATARYWGEGEAEQCRYANGADEGSRNWLEGTLASCRDGHIKTSPVGSYAANPWGLYDMLGNVHEWTADCWNSNYVGAPASGGAWQDGDCARRILRGGSWLSEPSRLRVADRRWPSDTAASRYDHFGLRVARTISSAQHASTQPFTVRTGPPDARVRITNIAPRYRPGIKLSPGRYDVSVTARGFETVTRTLRHGDEPTDVWIGLPFRDCPICPKMVEIPTGNYTMGTSKGNERYPDEGPAHDVAIQSPIAVGVQEVSFDEWDSCRNDGGCQRHLQDGGRGRGQHPVAQATLNDAREYANWLKVRTGRPYRLLSEAEWEYAARGGASSVRHWKALQDQCSYENGADVTAREEYSDWTFADCTDGYVHAAPSNDTRFSPNPWGLYHMLGNVSEWTEDCWHANYISAPPDGSAWTRDCGAGHVVRGGSWLSTPRNMRAPARFSYDPAEGHVNVGFRVTVEIIR